MALELFVLYYNWFGNVSLFGMIYAVELFIFWRIVWKWMEQLK